MTDRQKAALLHHGDNTAASEGRLESGSERISLSVCVCVCVCVRLFPSPDCTLPL